VVPKGLVLDAPRNIAEAFCTITFGSLHPDDPDYGRRMSSGFIAVSALGNVVLMSYTATRIKQEIAKEGILPFPKFFAQNYDFSVGRLLSKQFITRSLYRFIPVKWFAPENHRERTPVGAMILHFCSCLVLIVGTWGATAKQSYELFTSMPAYLINGIFGSLLSLGMLYLRFNPTAHWKKKSDMNPTLSIFAASIYLVLNLFFVICNWIPSTHPNSGMPQTKLP
jgi:hypothetical protein